MSIKIAGLPIDKFIETQENIIDQLEKDRAFLRKRLAHKRVKISRAKKKILNARELELNWD